MGGIILQAMGWGCIALSHLCYDAGLWCIRKGKGK